MARIAKTWHRQLALFTVAGLSLGLMGMFPAAPAGATPAPANTVVSWGIDYTGFSGAALPADLTGVAAISAGGSDLVLKTDGTVVTTGNAGVPAGLSGVTAIAAGYAHNLALKSDGTVVAWGPDTYGET